VGKEFHANSNSAAKFCVLKSSLCALSLLNAYSVSLKSFKYLKAHSLQVS
jgi:hypothetical protein